MNAIRRRELAQIMRQLHGLKVELDSVVSDEEESFDNLPAGLKDGERGNDIQEAVDNLQSISSLLDDALEELSTIADVALPEAKHKVTASSSENQKWLDEFDAARKAQAQRRRKADRAEWFLREAGFLVMKENDRSFERYYYGKSKQVTNEGAVKISKVEDTIKKENEKVRADLKSLFLEQNARIRKLVQEYEIEEEIE